MKCEPGIQREGRAHFIGICGAGMSGVAKLLRDQGWQVSGSDEGFYPPVSDFLAREGLPCLTPHDPVNIPAQVDLIVIGKHAKLTPQSNAEVRAAFVRQDRGEAEVRSFAEVLQKVTAGRRNIVVAGSYGKSTTTALLAWILSEAGRDPGYFIGAVPMGFSSTARLGTGELFVLEGDEYPAANWDPRSKFLFYNPQAVLLTSAEHDHFNAFRTEESYVSCYRQLVAALPTDGLLLGCEDGRHVTEIMARAPCRTAAYSARPQSPARWLALDRMTTGGVMTFALARRDDSGRVQRTIEVRTRIFGAHNAENAVGAAAMLLEMGAVTPEQAAAGLASFPGLHRRLEQKVPGASVAVYEDLSSSFPKATACLRAVRERHPEARITAVFQPHTFSFRSRLALQWYPGMFAEADSVIVFSPPNLQGLASAEELSHTEILQAIREGNRCPVIAAESREQAAALLDERLAPGDVVVLMTSGGMGGAIEAVRELVAYRFGA